MSREAIELLVPRIALVDDEHQIHASIRLRIGKDYEVVSFADPREALVAIGSQQFDLCIADIHMPHLDGLTFVERAKERDPALGFVVLSAFDTDENLRRTIPLRVYDFVPKPLPEPDGFEARIPGWIARTREARRSRALAAQADAIDRDLETALLERDVELVASESARDALMQAASLLTTVHAHLVTAGLTISARAKSDSGLASLARNLEAGRKAAEAAATVAEGFFESAYGHRDTSPALVDAGLEQAIGIACRMTRAEEAGKSVDFRAGDVVVPVRGLSGVDFLLMMVPVIAVAVLCSDAKTTTGVEVESVGRLDAVRKDPRFRSMLWANRRQAHASHAAVVVNVTATARPWSRTQAEAWLAGNDAALAPATPRGLIAGLRKCHGLLGISLAPPADKFRLVVALPV